MVLVPEDVLARFEQKQKQEISSVVENLMNMDKSSQEILRRTDMTDDEKQKSYYANLERYLILKQQKDSYVPTVKIAFVNEKKGVAEEPTLTEKVVALPDSVIVETVPKSIHGRAVSISNRSKSHPDIVSLNSTRHVRFDGVDIVGSNISDLLSDALRRSTTLILWVQKNFSKSCLKSTCLKTWLEIPKDGNKFNKYPLRTNKTSVQDHRL